MSRLMKFRPGLPLVVWTLALVVLGGGLFRSTVVAAELAAPSLALVPADASFYGAKLRNREQLEIVLNSKAWDAFSKSVFGKQMLDSLETMLKQEGGPLANLEPAMQMPENEQLLELLTDMVSDEVFLYTSAETADASKLSIELVSTLFTSAMAYETGARDRDLNQDELMSKAVLDRLNADLDRVRVPELVVGFRLSKKQPAVDQLKRLEAYAIVLLDFVEDFKALKGRVNRKKIGQGDYLTLSLDGGMIPWDEIPFEDLATESGQYDTLEKKLKSLTLDISLGIHGDYVILSIGPSVDHLARLGQGKTLAQIDELAPLRAAGEKRFTSIGYVSKAMVAALTPSSESVDSLASSLKGLLENSELPKEEAKRVADDLDALAKDLGGFLPKPSAKLNYTFLTTRGIEGFTYDWSTSELIVADKPLSVLKHLGGSPLLAYAARRKQDPKNYDKFAGWVEKLKGYFDRIAVPRMPAEARADYLEFAKLMTPLVQRADWTTRTMLIPSLADGQCAVLIGADVTSDQWHLEMPKTLEKAALPQPALVIGVSDASLLKQALAEYRSIGNDLLEALNATNPGELPVAEIPAPLLREESNGSKIYYYKLPRAWGVNKQVAPNLGLGKEVATLTLVPKQTQLLLKPTPLAVTGGPLANLERPLGSAFLFNANGTVDAATPWVNEAIWQFTLAMAQFRAGFGKALEPIGDDEEEDAIEAIEDVDDDGVDREALADSKEFKDRIAMAAELVSVLKAFRGYSSATYKEETAWVTHSEWHFKDLE